jgi:hypothetical protein
VLASGGAVRWGQAASLLGAIETSVAPRRRAVPVRACGRRAGDNSQAQRSLRPVVVIRKVSGGTRCPAGSQTWMALASLFATWRACGLNPFQACLGVLAPTA